MKLSDLERAGLISLPKDKCIGKICTLCHQDEHRAYNEALSQVRNTEVKITREGLREVIINWHRKHAGYFITNKIEDDITLADAILKYLGGENDG